jgi:hypothetical protein
MPIPYTGSEFVEGSLVVDARGGLGMGRRKSPLITAQFFAVGIYRHRRKVRFNTTGMCKLSERPTRGQRRRRTNAIIGSWKMILALLGLHYSNTWKSKMGFKMRFHSSVPWMSYALFTYLISVSSTMRHPNMLDDW